MALLEHLIATLPPGRERAGALAQLGWVREDDFESSSRLLDQALAEAGADPARTADIHLFLSDIWGIRGNVARARTESRLALADAERTTDRALLASSLAQAVWFDWMCGEDVDEAQLERALNLEHEVDSLALRTPPSEIAGLHHMSVGRLDQASAAFERALARAEAEGVEYWRADLLLRLAAIAGLRGDPKRAADLAEAGLEIAEQLDLTQLQSALLYGCGLAALQQGQVDASRSYALRGLELSRSVSDHIYQIGNEGLLGAVDLAVRLPRRRRPVRPSSIDSQGSAGDRAHNGSQQTPSRRSSERARPTTPEASWRPSKPAATTQSARRSRPAAEDCSQRLAAISTTPSPNSKTPYDSTTRLPCHSIAAAPCSPSEA